MQATVSWKQGSIRVGGGVKGTPVQPLHFYIRTLKGRWTHQAGFTCLVLTGMCEDVGSIILVPILQKGDTEALREE